MSKLIDLTGQIYGAFIDAMVGGAHIIEHIKYKPKIAMDINPYLIALYKYGQQPIHIWPDTITKEDWDRAKNHPDTLEPWFVGLVEFFTSYSARGFCGGWCMGGERDYYHERLRDFEKQLPQLQDVIFLTYDFFSISDDNLKGCLIYLDPPYVNTKKYDFSKNFIHEAFWDKVRKLSKHNAVIVSEQVAPEDFTVLFSLNTTRNAFGSKSTSASECLFIYKK